MYKVFIYILNIIRILSVIFASYLLIGFIVYGPASSIWQKEETYPYVEPNISGEEILLVYKFRDKGSFSVGLEESGYQGNFENCYIIDYVKIGIDEYKLSPFDGILPNPHLDLLHPSLANLIIDQHEAEQLLKLDNVELISDEKDSFLKIRLKSINSDDFVKNYNKIINGDYHD